MTYSDNLLIDKKSLFMYKYLYNMFQNIPQKPIIINSFIIIRLFFIYTLYNMTSHMHTFKIYKKKS